MFISARTSRSKIESIYKKRGKFSLILLSVCKKIFERVIVSTLGCLKLGLESAQIKIAIFNITVLNLICFIYLKQRVCHSTIYFPVGNILGVNWRVLISN